ncbi:hypothetical protein [Novosphingobium sp.]|uniref:hypothetical protein n=1 Tax=Novosphingobium sp. TaxID=1874826 RepID=UPI0035B07533
MKLKPLAYACAAVAFAIPAAALAWTSTAQGTGRSDAEAIAQAKRSAQDMVNNINNRTIRAYHTITGYGDPSCEPADYGRVRTCWVDVYITETSK